MYKITEEKIFVDGAEATVYGILHDDGTCVHDVSADKSEAEHMADLFNEQGLSSCQLRDVITDMIG